MENNKGKSFVNSTRYSTFIYSHKIPLLREYGEILSGARQRFSYVLNSYDGNLLEEPSREARMYNTLFLFDFVFKKMYKIKDFDEACRLVLLDRQKYIIDTHLDTLLNSKNIYVCRIDGGRHVVKTEDFALYLIYNGLDPMRDVIKCYNYLIDHGYKGRCALIMERDEIMRMMGNCRKRVGECDE